MKLDITIDGTTYSRKVKRVEIGRYHDGEVVFVDDTCIRITGEQAVELARRLNQ